MQHIKSNCLGSNPGFSLCWLGPQSSFLVFDWGMLTVPGVGRPQNIRVYLRIYLYIHFYIYLYIHHHGFTPIAWNLSERYQLHLPFTLSSLKLPFSNGEKPAPLSSIYLFTCPMPPYVGNLQTPPSSQVTQKLPSSGLHSYQAILPVHTNVLLNQRSGSSLLLTPWTTLRSWCKLPTLSSENVPKKICTKDLCNFKSFTLVALWHWAIYLNFWDFFFKYTSGAIKSVPSKKMG